MKRKIAYITITLALATGAFFVGKNTAEPVVKTEKQVVNVIPKSYIDTESKDFKKHYIDVREIRDIASLKTAYVIYLNNGNYYGWLKEE